LTTRDNALAESVVGLYKTECVRHAGPWRGVDDLESATMSWVAWFNTYWLQGEIGHVPPIEHENEYYRHNTAAQHPLPAEPSLHWTRGGSGLPPPTLARAYSPSAITDACVGSAPTAAPVDRSVGGVSGLEGLGGGRVAV